MNRAPRIAVIGAGMAGIAAARALHDAGSRVVVFEKSRGFGGRCATKRWENQRVDHGAQYFTIRSQEFRSALEAACGPSLKTIKAPILGADGSPLPDEPRFYHTGGNSRIARDLAEGLEVRLEQRVENPIYRDGIWSVAGESFNHVVGTAPWPQTLSLAHIADDPNPYHPCLTLVLRYSGHPSAKARGVYAISLPDDPVLSWTACENHKDGRVSGRATLLVAQASPPFSREHYDADPASWTGPLLTRVAAAWELNNLEPVDFFTHRWRYARVFTQPAPAQLPPAWHYAGDALGRSRVESAWMSGREKAQEILSLL